MRLAFRCDCQSLTWRGQECRLGDFTGRRLKIAEENTDECNFFVSTDVLLTRQLDRAFPSPDNPVFHP